MERLSNSEREAVYHEAINRYGENAQLDMLVEECAELIQAINKFKRNGSQHIGQVWHVNLIEELVDVEIMIEQMKINFKSDEDLFNEFMDHKVTRLNQRLNNKTK